MCPYSPFPPLHYLLTLHQLGDTVADLSIQERTRLIIEGATAYGIVKATFPVRVVWSIFMTPWFSRVFVEPGMNGLGKLWVMMRGKK